MKQVVLVLVNNISPEKKGALRRCGCGNSQLDSQPIELWLLVMGWRRINTFACVLQLVGGFAVLILISFFRATLKHLYI